MTKPKPRKSDQINKRSGAKSGLTPAARAALARTAAARVIIGPAMPSMDQKALTEHTQGDGDE